MVGPRPITEAEMTKYGSKAGAILAVNPDITGYWQINEDLKVELEHHEPTRALPSRRRRTARSRPASAGGCR
jgi:lipopolysaccharide/colanic/teichoic acid biosynthesis glycosyltransferase